MNNYGYWNFEGRNGLAGLDGTWVETDGGVPVYMPHPTNPAVLQPEVILNALASSRAARAAFNRIYPTLSQDEQERLDGLLDTSPNIRKSVQADSNAWNDRLQYNAVRSIPVHTAGKRGGGN